MTATPEIAAERIARLSELARDVAAHGDMRRLHEVIDERERAACDFASVDIEDLDEAASQRVQNTLERAVRAQNDLLAYMHRAQDAIEARIATIRHRAPAVDAYHNVGAEPPADRFRRSS